jgi:hypothetical protein
VVPCAYHASLDFTAQVAGPGACRVPLQQTTQALSLLRVHQLLLNVFVRLVLVALAARSAHLAPSGVYCAARHHRGSSAVAAHTHSSLAINHNRLLDGQQPSPCTNPLQQISIASECFG